MRTHAVKSRIIHWQFFGFGLVVLSLWLDEILDLPSLLLGAPVTPINWLECFLETVYVLVLALIVTRMTRRLLRRVHYLEEFLRVCSRCNRIHTEGMWVPMEQYLGEKAEIRVSRGLCPDCEKILYPS